MFFKGKKILITGGTGSCGHQLVHSLQKQNPQEIVIFSRDEKKHFDMQYELREHKNIRFIIGDVRDAERINEALSGIDVVFHTAAMKHVNQCQQNPSEAVKTNILGTRNVVNAAISNGVKNVISLSTDKAVMPVNLMGMTKAVGEQMVIEGNKSPKNKGTKLSCVRYGNVMNSRGSAIPFFRHLLDTNKTIPITDKNMTRFMLTLGDAIELIFYAAENGKGGEIFVRKAPSVKIIELAQVLSSQKGRPFKHNIIGAFPGEKIHETLVSASEMTRTQDKGKYYVITQDNGKSTSSKKDYSSDKALVTKKEIPALLNRADMEYKQSHMDDMFRKE
ncbi:MAG: SDR family NAD(P)-dependent oxidoreductase [Nanoarchaeota archaeon]|nr:MAG: SDR family NAD(P)-dependent oxidoreductase [Nanoarchaeota archaeon]